MKKQFAYIFFKKHFKLCLITFFAFHSSLFTYNCNAQYLLYGLTATGGTYNYGTIFYYNPASGKDSVLFNFSGTNGDEPVDDLFQASDGLFYAMTNLGGTSNFGTVFNFNVNTNIENVLINCNGANGKYPDGGGNDFIQGKDGLLYSTSVYGGTHGAGILFSYNIITHKDSIRFNFDTMKSGFGPCRALFQDTSTGLLYGSTIEGGSDSDAGLIYCFNPATNKDSVLIVFNHTSGPSLSSSSFIRATNGLLYSMAEGGGDSNVGVIYTYNISTGAVNIVFSFNKTNGAYPYGNNLLQLPGGMMYGMTFEGGTYYDGVIFSFNPVNDSEKVLVNFNDTNGGFPEGNLIYDPDNGLLYGMTRRGGTSEKGVFFSYDITTSTFTKIFDFTGPNGAFPYSGLTLVKDSSLLTGVKQEKGESEGVRVYPNPNNGIAELVINNYQLGMKYSVAVFNVFGQKVYSALFQLPPASSTCQINLSSQPEGVYLYRVLKVEEIASPSLAMTVVGQGKIIIEK